ncbi:hypothetical protein ACFWSF_26150 [Streptomyces sp. NPDC058611]|uniref:hypothetical protein n=1 Tax=unclassified Streptomyces TaxID=2593676 RepID=UPI00364B8626
MTMAFPPVARMVETPGWFISAPVASMEGTATHWTQSSGAPACLLDGELRELAVPGQRRQRGLLDDVVDLLLVERLEPAERRERALNQSAHHLVGLHDGNSFISPRSEPAIRCFPDGSA